jgi:signal transduction histidine kinase
MKSWVGGWGGALALLGISALVAGGLGWATLAALRLEQAQLEQQAAQEHAEKARLALWRLDSRMTALLAAEDARPFNHYSALFVPPAAISNAAQAWPAGSVLEPSPLLSAPLEPWMLLHFQVSASGWESPQVLSDRLLGYLRKPHLRLDLSNVTAERRRLLGSLGEGLPEDKVLAAARHHTKPASIQTRVLLARLNELEVNNTVYNLRQEGQALREYGARLGVQSRLVNPQKENYQKVERELALNCRLNGEEWLSSRLLDGRDQEMGKGGKGTAVIPVSLLPGIGGGPPNESGKQVTQSSEVQVRMSPHAGAWATSPSGDRLFYIRLVKLEDREVCQGILLDAGRLASLFREEVADLLPEAAILPSREEASSDLLPLVMASLPFRLDPGPAPPPEPAGWTGLRVGLLLAWVAALVALTAVGLGGWGLLSLSASRGRFVSAVTHELRTPLTTLRLYLDMLLGGMVRDEAQREEYMRTLHAETDRLTRLVANVLDYSRLEGHASRVNSGPVEAASILAEVQSAWRIRCETSNKELVVECLVAEKASCRADAVLLVQVLGNLLDNACKYSHDAEDRRVWLRARAEGARLVFEVEDRGPGVAASERRTIFRAFHRGREAGESTGGVGLGLALASHWAAMMGGTLTLHTPKEGGACFRVELPSA